MKSNKILILSAAAVLVVGFLLFSLEKLQVTNIYVKPVSVQNGDTTRPVNDVDYTPETSAPDGSINNEKNTGESTNANASNEVTVSITRANQDTANNLNIGVLIDGTTTGTCKLELLLQNSEAGVIKEAPVITQSGISSCAGFYIPVTEIPGAGTYSIKVSVGNASVTQTVELKK